MKKILIATILLSMATTMFAPNGLEIVFAYNKARDTLDEIFGTADQHGIIETIQKDGSISSENQNILDSLAKAIDDILDYYKWLEEKVEEIKANIQNEIDRKEQELEAKEATLQDLKSAAVPDDVMIEAYEGFITDLKKDVEDLQKQLENISKGGSRFSMLVEEAKEALNDVNHRTMKALEKAISAGKERAAKLIWDYLTPVYTKMQETWKTLEDDTSKKELEKIEAMIAWAKVAKPTPTPTPSAPADLTSSLTELSVSLAALSSQI